MIRNICAAFFTRAIFLAILLAAPLSLAHADEFDTNFKISVLAKDAKFIGTHVGGVRIIVRDKLTGDILVDGYTYGTTGDTKTIMADSRKRHAVLSDSDSANFQFALQILEPTKVTITAIAPLAQMQSAVKVSEDYTLIPGKDYTSGDGIVLTMPGIAVDVLQPVPNSDIPFNADEPITIEANVMKLCGCKVADGSPWPSDDFSVQAHVYRDTKYISAVPMQYVGHPGQFITKLKIPKDGTYKILVTAFDKKTKEGGMDATTVNLVAPKDGDKKATEK